MMELSGSVYGNEGRNELSWFRSGDSYELLESVHGIKISAVSKPRLAKAVARVEEAVESVIKSLRYEKLLDTARKKALGECVPKVNLETIDEQVTSELILMELERKGLEGSMFTLAT